jgi:hypothetical protein
VVFVEMFDDGGRSVADRSLARRANENTKLLVDYQAEGPEERFERRRYFEVGSSV